MSNKPICSYCGQDYHGDARILCEVCHMQVCPHCFNGDADMCYDCYNGLQPCECEICGCLLDEEDFVSCDTCGYAICHRCSPDDCHCKECYEEMEEDEPHTYAGKCPKCKEEEDDE